MASLVALFGPAGGALGAMLTLVMVDAISGILASKKLGQPITSKRFRDTVTKLLVYLTVICLAHLVGTYLAPNMKILELVSSTVGLSELLSVLENLNILAGGNLLSSLVGRLNPKPSAQEQPHNEEPEEKS